MRRYVRVAIGVVVSLLFAGCLSMMAPPSVTACSIATPGTSLPPAPTPTVQQAFAQADMVFRGELLRWEDVSYQVAGGAAARVTFSVTTLWKGSPATSVAVVAFGNNCTQQSGIFGPYGAYIVYAKQETFPNGTNGLAALDGSKYVLGPVEEDRVLGPGTTVQGVTGTAPALPATQVPSPTSGVAASTSGAGLTVLWIAAVVTAVAGISALLVMRHRARV